MDVLVSEESLLASLLSRPMMLSEQGTSTQDSPAPLRNMIRHKELTLMTWTNQWSIASIPGQLCCAPIAWRWDLVMSAAKGYPAARSNWGTSSSNFLARLRLFVILPSYALCMKRKISWKSFVVGLMRVLSEKAWV